MSLFNNKPTPVRLHKKVSWREKYEVEIIFAKGIILKCWRLLVSCRMMSITVLMMNTMI